MRRALDEPHVDFRIGHIEKSKGTVVADFLFAGEGRGPNFLAKLARCVFADFEGNYGIHSVVGNDFSLTNRGTFAQQFDPNRIGLIAASHSHVES